jgi:hypothetical protein
MAYESGVPKSVADIIRQHHERPGGKGYPYKVEPSLPALVLAACDVYAAATEIRKSKLADITMPGYPGFFCVLFYFAAMLFFQLWRNFK